MTHHYAGDINGEVWPGVQACDDADFFGKEGLPPEPTELCYELNSDDLTEIEAGLETCREQLGAWKQKLDASFALHPDYDNQMLAEETGLHAKAVPSLLEWYARLQLAKSIRRCVIVTGASTFSADL